MWYTIKKNDFHPDKGRNGEVMKDVLRVGVAVPPLRVADVTYNLEKIRKQLKEAAAAGVSVLAFPELATPYFHPGILTLS